MNHYYDTDRAATRCGEYEGETAFHVSANDRVSCPDCLDTLTPDERAGQWYDRLDDDEATDTRNHTTRDQLAETIEAHSYTYPDSFCSCHAFVTHATYATHLADALLASDVIAAVRAAAVAETTATIEALADRLLDPTAMVAEGPMISRLKAASMVRAALSGGRTAHDTCGHPNHGSPDHDCTPFRADTGADQ